ncbi:hypothetical protein GCK32_013048, partial [Trichostrongylus colubriformis]
FLQVTRAFSGWESNYSFSLLCFISSIGTLFYAEEFVGHILFLIDTPAVPIDQFFGAMFMACFLVETMAGISLVVHRVVHIATPFKAERIFTPVVLKIHMILLVAFFLTLVAVLCSPLAGVMYCPDTMDRYAEFGPVTGAVFGLNKMCNYMVGISTFTAYAIIVVVLFVRGNITFHTNAELRMMLQVSIMSTVGAFYFIFWEFRHLVKMDKVASTIIYENLSLFYYNAVMLPYLLLNPTVRREFLKILQKKRSRCNVLHVEMAKSDCTGRRMTVTKIEGNPKEG